MVFMTTALCSTSLLKYNVSLTGYSGDTGGFSTTTSTRMSQETVQDNDAMLVSVS